MEYIYIYIYIYIYATPLIILLVMVKTFIALKVLLENALCHGNIQLYNLVIWYSVIRSLSFNIHENIFVILFKMCHARNDRKINIDFVLNIYLKFMWNETKTLSNWNLHFCGRCCGFMTGFLRAINTKLAHYEKK